MAFDAERAAIRFGCGLSPSQQAPASVEDMLSLLAGPDTAAQTFPIPGIKAAFKNYLDERAANKTYKDAVGQVAQEEALALRKAVRRKIQQDGSLWFGQALLRRAKTADGFRERLVSFWTDHFTAVGKVGTLRFAQITYAEDAIRPHVAGRFADMLRAVATHPFMLTYLDQVRSFGPNSKAANHKGKKRGLNENLAREMLELHTLGVDGPYTQEDVRQLAELLTGLSYNRDREFVFRPSVAEPGSETVLNTTYGGRKARLEDVFAVLNDLAVHPATARHLAGKLAVHFIGDEPDPALISALEKRYSETGGDLMAVYEVLLTHPGAWLQGVGNVKQPMDFVGSSLRALDLQPQHVPVTKARKMRDLFFTPMVLMGQRWGQAAGPDGWPEADMDWITPQRLASRLQWAMAAPSLLRRALPDPRDFTSVALGRTAPEVLRFAAKAAETRAEGVGLVLASPAFQRM